jgi:hypothetical protein
MFAARVPAFMRPRFFLSFLLLLGAFGLGAANLSGKWSGSIDAVEDGQSRTVSVLLILKQDGPKLSGTAGGDENDQHTITKANVDGDKLSLEIDGGDVTFYLDLIVDGDQMTGDARRGDSPRMKISVKRVKEG